jgi:hypothetical protein
MVLIALDYAHVEMGHMLRTGETVKTQGKHPDEKDPEDEKDEKENEGCDEYDDYCNTSQDSDSPDADCVDDVNLGDDGEDYPDDPVYFENNDGALGEPLTVHGMFTS